MIELKITTTDDNVVYSYFVRDTGTDSTEHEASDADPLVEVCLPKLARTLSTAAKVTANNRSFSAFVWPAALVLGAMLVHHRDEIFGKEVIELGAGRALPTLVARGVGAGRALATDREEYVVEHELRIGKARYKEEMSVFKLDWGVFTNDAVRRCSTRVHYVIASDVWYSECGAGEVEEQDMLDAFMATFCLIKRHNPDVVLMTTIVNRSDQQMRLVKSVLSAWNCKVVQSFRAEDLVDCSAGLMIASVEAWIVK